jgi:hypothetical protein
MRETLFDVWVIETHPDRVPTIKQYQAMRWGDTSISVMDHGRLSVIRSAAHLKWFLGRDEAKAYARSECERLRAKLEAELAAVSETLAADRYTMTQVPHERPKLWDAPLGGKLSV